jgi:hypothetical protein
VAIEEVVVGQVFTGRRTSLRAEAASQVFARSGTASRDKDAGHRPEGQADVGHAFKIGGRAKARRRVRFPSASATEMAPFTSGVPSSRAPWGWREGLIRARTTVFSTQVFRCSLRPRAGQVFRPPAGGPDKSRSTKDARRESPSVTHGSASSLSAWPPLRSRSKSPDADTPPLASPLLSSSRVSAVELGAGFNVEVQAAFLFGEGPGELVLCDV